LEQRNLEKAVELPESRLPSTAWKQKVEHERFFTLSTALFRLNGWFLLALAQFLTVKTEL
jgi:hypothetical protein